MNDLAGFINYLSHSKFFADKETIDALIATLVGNQQGLFDEDTPSYQEISCKKAVELKCLMDDKDPINITSNFDEPEETPSDSLAYHRIFGPIIADYNWRWSFSTKRFINNIKAAEENPNIIAHFVHISSGGGEAWLLDKAFEAMVSTNKPIIVFGEKVIASAGLYFASGADKIYSYTQNDTWGSLGTMVYFINFMPYYIKLGVQEVEAYATKSDLKNKKFNDLIKGGKNAKNYIENELDPLQEQFETAVRSKRPIVAKLPEDHPVVRGETFSTPQAIELGLVDEMAEIEVAILDAYNRGLDWQKKQKAHNNAISYL